MSAIAARDRYPPIWTFTARYRRVIGSASGSDVNEVHLINGSVISPKRCTVRLSLADRQLIRQTVAARAGPAAEIRLFGSRVRDDRRGGDIDLLVDLPDAVSDRLHLECKIAAALERAFDGRRVDVVIAAPNVPHLPIHAIARATGIPL